MTAQQDRENVAHAYVLHLLKLLLRMGLLDQMEYETIVLINSKHYSVR